MYMHTTDTKLHDKIGLLHNNTRWPDGKSFMKSLPSEVSEWDHHHHCELPATLQASDGVCGRSLITMVCVLVAILAYTTDAMGKRASDSLMR